MVLLWLLEMYHGTSMILDIYHGTTLFFILVIYHDTIWLLERHSPKGLLGTPY